MDFDWLRFAKGQVLLSMLCLLLVFLIVMAAEFLHYVSDGKIPRCIEWQPARARRVDVIEDDDEEGVDDEGVTPSLAEKGIILWNERVDLGTRAPRRQFFFFSVP